MIRGVRGALLSLEALERLIPATLAGRLGEAGCPAAWRHFRAWHRGVRPDLGPSASPRRLVDQLAIPLAAHLGYRASAAGGDHEMHRLVLHAGHQPLAALVVTTWARELSGAWRQAVRQGLHASVRWSLCLSGPALRVVDAARTYSRRYLEFDLASAADDEETFRVLWGLLRADAMRGRETDGRPVLEVALDLSEQHRALVRASLQSGVHDALATLRGAISTAWRRPANGGIERDRRVSSESLTIVYRLLFLLFAEARGLVPSWHPVYRQAYTLAALDGALARGSSPRGAWETLQAIARLAHRGCRAGSLAVTAFNGPLFAPHLAPLADTLRLDDGAVRAALLALTTRRARHGRERITYADLGVEQLGAVYERLLDEPATTGRSGLRRETGSFYTPRPLTDTVVRRTLAPLVSGAPPEQILSLRIVDPAMGSGAFLVSACRYLATAYEAALVEHGHLGADDVTDGDRAQFRRVIAQRCLFGVDLNPVAVHLGRLSLWLATLAGDRPLTFLDHHLRAGDSLVGASVDDLLRRPPPGGGRLAREGELPLFPQTDVDRRLAPVCTARLAVTVEPGDTLEQVRRKERLLSGVDGAASPLSPWKQLADLWCSGWFRERRERARFRRVFDALASETLGGRAVLPAHIRSRLMADAERVSASHAFFHWPLEFPEVFYDAHGTPRADAGFDAVLCNPPWETLRGERGGADDSAPARARAKRTVEFARTSGVYRWQGDGHANLYQLFTERAVALLRPGGRLGLIVPSGLASDHGSARLRQALLEQVSLDTFVGVDNRAGLFPIHRSLRFVVLSGRTGSRTAAVPARNGVAAADDLERIPEVGPDPLAVPLPRAFLDAFSGSQQAVPNCRSAEDRDIAAALVATAPPLGDPSGWRLSFGRELNLTEDRGLFASCASGVPVIEGKHLQPFTAAVATVRHYVPLQRAAALAGRIRFQQARLAYRDVASPGNRLTLIAAVVPASVLTAHTVFCSREPLDELSLHYLCGVLNSFVANYLVRLRVSTHVTATILAALPVPLLASDPPAAGRIAAQAHRLAGGPFDRELYVSLQSDVARLYGLDRPSLRHVLGTFPLVEPELREAVLAAFTV